MGAKSRRKGKSGELEFVHLAQAAGFADAQRSAPMQAATGDEKDADLRGVGRIWGEVKRHRRVNVQKWVSEMLATERPGYIRVLFHRDDNGVPLATLEATELLKLERDALRVLQPCAEVIHPEEGLEAVAGLTDIMRWSKP